MIGRLREESKLNIHELRFIQDVNIEGTKVGCEVLRAKSVVTFCPSKTPRDQTAETYHYF